MTVRELLEKINRELKENWEKPVIRTNKDKNFFGTYYEYDYENGRKVISVDEIRKEVGFYIGAYCYAERNKICLEYSDLTLICKSKKSGITKDSYNRTECLTVVSVAIENTELLDKELDYFKQQVQEFMLKRASNDENKYNNFKEKLEKCGLSLSDLKSLYRQYESLDYKYRKMVDDENIVEG